MLSSTLVLPQAGACVPLASQTDWRPRSCPLLGKNQTVIPALDLVTWTQGERCLSCLSQNGPSGRLGFGPTLPRAGEGEGRLRVRIGPARVRAGSGSESARLKPGRRLRRSHCPMRNIGRAARQPAATSTAASRPSRARTARAGTPRLAVPRPEAVASSQPASPCGCPNPHLGNAGSRGDAGVPGGRARTARGAVTRILARAGSAGVGTPGPACQPGPTKPQAPAPRESTDGNQHLENDRGLVAGQARFLRGQSQPTVASCRLLLNSILQTTRHPLKQRYGR